MTQTDALIALAAMAVLWAFFGAIVISESQFHKKRFRTAVVVIGFIILILPVFSQVYIKAVMG